MHIMDGHTLLFPSFDMCACVQVCVFEDVSWEVSVF